MSAPLMSPIPEPGVHALRALLNRLVEARAVRLTSFSRFSYEPRDADFTPNFEPLDEWPWDWRKLAECPRSAGEIIGDIYYQDPHDKHALVVWEFWKGDKKTAVIGLADRETGTVWLQKAAVVAYLAVLAPALEPLVATLLKTAWLLE